MSHLGTLLVQDHVISLEQLQQAQISAKKEGGRLGASLVKLGLVDEKQLTGFISKKFGVPAINLEEQPIDEEVVKLIPKDVAVKHLAIAINRAGSTLIVAMADPSNLLAIDELKFQTSLNIEVVVASESAIRSAIDKYYAGSKADDSSAAYEEVMEGFNDEDIEVGEEEEELNSVDLAKSAEDAPVVRLVNLILMDAIKRHASDIHIEPYEKSFRVRYRIDGVLYEVMTPPLKLKNAITSRIKIMSNLDIAERRLPQDGRIKLKFGGGKDMDFRVSVLPCLFGEKIVLRLLDKSNLQLDMTKLGFEPKPLSDFKSAIHKPFGMVLVTGPTGSGKTTTLYSALSELNKVSENISTAEDPVEFNLGGINQVQMHEDIGLNFSAALRSFLRQDPDIIMVGEIRDFETAEIAIKAALTGHMVLSTLHTNDAPSTVSRLLNMGVEPFLITAALNAILAQRLARRICENCKEEITVPDQTLLDIQIKPEEIGTFKLYKGRGCEKCSNTGYKGRVALYEVLVCSDPIREAVLNGASSAELKAVAIQNGMQTLRAAALNKLRLGMTTVEEVLRCSVAD